MASPPLPCALTTTTSAASSHPLFPKPPHFTIHIKRSHRLNVSCTVAQNHNDSSQNVDTSQGKVIDRRNMLLGLGGLYGAANLVSTLMRIRPSAHKVSLEYIYKYNLAIDRMKRLPADDPRNFMQQANIHCTYCNGAYDQPGQGSLDLQVHNSWLFFPFHRSYLYFYERILGKLIGDPTFALPFWNWDNPKCHAPSPRARDVVANNITIMYTKMIRGNSDIYDFMGQAYHKGTAVNPGPGSSERGSHTTIHVWVGDPRRRDPLFYCHHANVDCMWPLWQYYLPSNKVPDKRITEPDFLNASFLFYDKNARLVPVKVKDTLDNLRMGPSPQTAKAKILRASTTVPKASTLFPLNLDRVFDVLVNDKDDNALELDKASYAGIYAQVAHKTTNKTATTTIRLKLTDLYEDMDINDDDTIVMTFVPRHQCPGVTIGGVKIIEAPATTSTTVASSS
ncbi:Catechol oxidase [Handroanthus impetiginosus]|uniref:Catechol oxidase n=1 Tax=Handroanthus impetiginosus TaxID=429701 RepID=A0A2G9H9F5_9LAMI|nr:Catechol oxidase [Handroanthus impetiginosus]